MSQVSAPPPADDISTLEITRERRAAGPWRQIWWRFRRNPLALLGLIVFILIVVMAVAAPLITPGVNVNTNYSTQIYLGITTWAPSTDQFPALLFGLMGPQVPLGGLVAIQNHSVLALVTYGARPSLIIGVGAALISTTIGIVLGVISGYFGGTLDDLIMRVTDLVLAFPFLPLVIAIAIASHQHPTVTSLLITFSLVGWPGTARIMRAQMLVQREQAYTEAAYAAGINDWRIIFRHLLPNAIAPVIVAGALAVATFILAESTLDYIQLGITTVATWGNEIAFGQDYLASGYWWDVFYPGLFVVLTALSATFIGEGLRDALDSQ